MLKSPKMQKKPSNSVFHNLFPLSQARPAKSAKIKRGKL